MWHGLKFKLSKVWRYKTTSFLNNSILKYQGKKITPKPQKSFYFLTTANWEQVVGVARNPQAVRLNAFLLKKLADHWCPQWTSPRMLPIDEAKAEASSVLKHMVAKSV